MLPYLPALDAGLTGPSNSLPVDFQCSELHLEDSLMLFTYERCPCSVLGATACGMLAFCLSTETKGPASLSVMLEGAGSGERRVVSGQGQKMQSCLKSVLPRDCSVISPGKTRPVFLGKTLKMSLCSGSHCMPMLGQSLQSQAGGQLSPGVPIAVVAA